MRTLSRRLYYGWWVAVAASGISFANAATAIGVLTVFVIPMSEEFGWNRTEVAGATSLGAVFGAALAPFSGRLVDRLGARLILVAGGLVVVLGCLYLSTAQTLLGFYAAFAAIRIADQGLIQIGASVTAGKWFLKYRGRATGLVLLGGSAGILVLAPAVQLVISNWDWRTAWMGLAVVMLCLGVIPAALIIRRQPEDLGLVIDGGPRPVQSATGPELSMDDQPFPVTEAIRTFAFWAILVSLFLISTATSGIGLHLVPHLVQQGLTPAAAVGAVSVMSVSAALAALISGIAAERTSAKMLMILFYVVGAASMWLLMRADTLPEAYLFAIVQGSVISSVNTLSPLVWASYYGRRTLGSIFGLSRAAQVVGFAVGPLGSAVVFDRTGTYQGAFLTMAFVSLAASLILLAARHPVMRHQPPQTSP